MAAKRKLKLIATGLPLRPPARDAKMNVSGIRAPAIQRSVLMAIVLPSGPRDTAAEHTSHCLLTMKCNVYTIKKASQSAKLLHDRVETTRRRELTRLRVYSSSL